MKYIEQYEVWEVRGRASKNLFRCKDYTEACQKLKCSEYGDALYYALKNLGAAGGYVHVREDVYLREKSLIKE